MGLGKCTHVFRNHDTGDGGAQKPIPAYHRPYTDEQFFGRTFFENVSGRSGPQHILDKMLSRVDGKGYDPGVRKRRNDLSGGVDPAETRHGDVHHHDIRRQLPHLIDGFLSVPGLTDHFYILLFFEQQTEALPK